MTEWYRYDMIGYLENDIPWIVCTPYLVAKETEHSVYINGGGKRIGKRWLKKFAYPTKEEAFLAFRKRKEKQIKIIVDQLDRARDALAATECGFEKFEPYDKVKVFDDWSLV